MSLNKENERPVTVHPARKPVTTKSEVSHRPRCFAVCGPDRPGSYKVMSGVRLTQS